MLGKKRAGELRELRAMGWCDSALIRKFRLKDQTELMEELIALAQSERIFAEFAKNHPYLVLADMRENLLWVRELAASNVRGAEIKEVAKLLSVLLGVHEKEVDLFERFGLVPAAPSARASNVEVIVRNDLRTFVDDPESAELLRQLYRRRIAAGLGSIS